MKKEFLFVLFFICASLPNSASAYFAEFSIYPSTISTSLPQLGRYESDFVISIDSNFEYDGSRAEYIIEPPMLEWHFDENGEIVYQKDPTSLCPYISIEPAVNEPGDKGFAFQFLEPFFDEAYGVINPEAGDDADDWKLSIISPCFEGECPNGYNENLAGPPLPQSLKGQTFTCNYTVKSNFIAPMIIGLGPKETIIINEKSSANTLMVSAVFAGTSPAPLTLPEKAAELAKQVIGADYLGDGETYGGKGWDTPKHTYVDASKIFDGYNFWNNNEKHRKVEFGAGLDCSGLVEWTYNYSFDPNKSLLENAIRVWGANSQYLENSTPISESELKPGDLLFLDKKNRDFRDHVALYVGEFTHGGESYTIVEAFAPKFGILPTTLSDFKSRPGFTNIVKYGSNPIRRVVLSPKIAGKIKVGSPVDLSVTDPEGLTITPYTILQTDEEYLNEVPGELYYSERELGTDGRPQDTVYWFKNKTGDYRVQVMPEPDTRPGDTYSLEFTLGDQTTKLAQNVPISEIPAAGYYVKVNEGGVESSGPVSTDYLLGKIRSHINSFEAPDILKKPLLAMVDAIEKRTEVNRKLQDKLVEQIEKLKQKPGAEKVVDALEKKLQNLKDNEAAVLKELASAEKTFSQKASQKVSKEEAKELLKILTKVLLTFNQSDNE